MERRFTCINCRVAFDDLEIQRQHYKTDWHRYNLKRKVAELPPVTAEDFVAKVCQQREKDAAESKDTALFCKVCRKVFASSKAFENHLNSKKHKAYLSKLLNGSENSSPVTVDVSEPVNGNISKDKEELVQEYDSLGDDDFSDMETDSEVEEVDSDEWDDEMFSISENNPILSNNCLFCTHHSATMTKNVNHMAVEHSFYIPDLEYLVDSRGLLLYLGEKVCSLFTCLWCDSSGRSFYSVEAVQTHMRDKGHCKMLYEGASLAQYSAFYNYAKSYPDNDENMDIDEPVSVPVLDDSDYELTLPSGAKIGHRDLVIYYRQHLNPNREIVKKTKIGRLMATYRALGWRTSDKEAETRRAKDMRYISKLQAKYSTNLGVKANKLQKHFRPQVNF